MFKDAFKKRKYLTVSKIKINDEELQEEKPSIPDGLWNKCPMCSSKSYYEDIAGNEGLCLNCSFHFRLSAKERISRTFDAFQEFFQDIETTNPINFPEYFDKVNNNKDISAINEAVITGIGSINNMKAAVCVMDSNFMMGSMGTVVGEKIAKTAELSLEHRIPLIIFTASGGARMQEGIFSLMQMAKVSTVLSKLDEEGILFISVLTDPTMGGVTASFAMQADIILSEPGASIGFAGKRVIEKTINETLPPGFQKAEFLKEKGFIDKIVNRKELKDVLYKLLSFHEVS